MTDTTNIAVALHLPCKKCGSSDAKTIYSDGHSFCFSCRNYIKLDQEKDVKRGNKKYISSLWSPSSLDKAEEIEYPISYNTISSNRIDTDNGLFNDSTIGGSRITPIPPKTPLPSYSLDASEISSLAADSRSWLPMPQPDPKSPSTAFLGPSRASLDGAHPPGTELEASRGIPTTEVTPTLSLPNEKKPYRGLDKATLSAYHVGVRDNHVDYGYGEGYKTRRLSDKKFWTTGKFGGVAPLFGMHLFPPGSAKAITLFEGEDDAMAAYEMTGSKYPCVSIPGGAQLAEKDCARHREYINSFDAIYLCLDNDKPGREATERVAKLFNPNKVYIVDLHKYKDAMELFEAGKAKDFVSIWYAAKRHRPKGIVSSYGEVERILSQEQAGKVADYPFETLNGQALGIRTSEVVLITAPSGIGKTEVLRAIEYHLLKTTDYNIGVIHLEERERRAMMGLITYHLKTPAHRPDSGLSLEDKIKAYKDLTKRDDRVHYYQHFGSEDPNVILDIIRHLVTVENCKFIFLDHITMLVTGQKGDDERKVLDYLSTALASLTRELDFGLFLVSHENANEGTRGSANIENIADLWFRVNRDKLSPDPEVRNTVTILTKKNRFGSDTGPGGVLKFDTTTYTLSEQSIRDDFHLDVKPETDASYAQDTKTMEMGTPGTVQVERPWLLGQPSSQTTTGEPKATNGTPEDNPARAA